jgi:hypothetical protein
MQMKLHCQLLNPTESFEMIQSQPGMNVVSKRFRPHEIPPSPGRMSAVGLQPQLWLESREAFNTQPILHYVGQSSASQYEARPASLVLQDMAAYLTVIA